MLSVFSMLAMSGHPLPTSATFVVGGHTYTVTVQYLPGYGTALSPCRAVCARPGTETPCGPLARRRSRWHSVSQRTQRATYLFESMRHRPYL